MANFAPSALCFENAKLCAVGEKRADGAHIVTVVIDAQIVSQQSAAGRQHWAGVAYLK